MAYKQKYDSTFYTTYNIGRELENPVMRKELRQEYIRLRKIANKRLQRIEQAGFSNSSRYKYNKASFKALSTIKSDYEFSAALVFLDSFLSSKTTVREIRKTRNKTVEALQDRGYDFVNSGNIDAFADFMDDMRARGISNLLPSSQIADQFGIAEKKGVSPSQLKDAFDRYLAVNAENKNIMTQARRKSPEKLWEDLANYDLYSEGTPSTRDRNGKKKTGKSKNRKP